MAREPRFTPKVFLATIGRGKTFVDFTKKQMVFSQGNAADALFYVESGRIKISVTSHEGKEAVIGILGPGEFFGEGCFAGQRRCSASATALDPSHVLQIDKQTMIDTL